MSNTLWYNSTLNSNITASVFNQLYNTKAVEAIRVNNGLLYAILGKKWLDNNEPDVPQFERLEKVSGYQIEVRILGLLDTISTVATGSAQLASATVVYDSNMFGGAQFMLTHYAQTNGIPDDEYVRIEGDEAKTLNYFDDVFNQIMLSYEQTVGTAISSTTTTAMSATTMGTWVWAVSDGTSTGANATESSYAVYGGIDRSQSANAMYQGAVNANTNAPIGPLTLGKVQLNKTYIRSKGGRVQIAPCPTPVYTKVMALLEAYGHWEQGENSGDWVEFGGAYAEYSGIKFILDDYVPAGTIGLIDPTTWTFYQSMQHFTRTGFIYAPHLIAGWVMPWGAYTQMICIRPRSNGKMVGINT